MEFRYLKYEIFVKEQYRICIEFLPLNKKLTIIDKLIPKNDKNRFMAKVLKKILNKNQVLLLNDLINLF